MDKKKRGRPKKPRNITKRPFTSQFSPRGHIGRPGHVEVSLSDYEAMRLADFIGLSQKQAAASMGVSQQTYSRILRGARKCLIEGIVLGKIINIMTTQGTPQNPLKRAARRQKPAFKKPT